eukprot:g4746.t1
MAQPAQFTFSRVPLRRVEELQFAVWSPDEIESMSVTQKIKIQGKEIPAGVHRVETLENGQPVYGGPNDPRMKGMDRDDPDCPGYFGHIKLERKMYNIGYINTVRTLLQCVCHSCSKLLVDERNEDFRQIVTSGVSPKDRLGAIYNIAKGKMKCIHCNENQPHRILKAGAYKLTVIRKTRGEDEIGDNEAMEAGGGGGSGGVQEREIRENLPADKVHEILFGISDKDMAYLGFHPKYSRPSWLLWDVLPVAPPPLRPSVQFGAGASEDDLTHKYINIVKANLALGKDFQGDPETVKQEKAELLQYHVATLVDNQIAGQAQDSHKNGQPLKTIRERLVGKFGRVRGNLMGKRVNFSARSVITADPILSMQEVGVPKSIAKNLTVRETVTPFNLKRLQQLVANGHDYHPGANKILRPNGTEIQLDKVDNRNDIELATGWVLERHLDDGDVVLFNRQPSLHKMSIMAHFARVLNWSTFRLNLSCTPPYNADFDGDEMNLHVPQSLEARAEAESMMLTPYMIVSPQGNRPVMSIVQDSLLGSAKMTHRDVFIDKPLLLQIVMWIHDWDGRIPAPAIMVPSEETAGKYTPYWTGKQVFSMICPRVNMGEARSVCDKSLQKNDGKVLIVDGELLAGVVNKKVLGKGQNALIHVTWLEHGPLRARDLIDQVQVVANNWLIHWGFTIGVGDTVADGNTMREIKDILDKAKRQVGRLVQKGQKGELEVQPGRTIVESFEDLVNRTLNDARDNAGKKAQNSLLKDNNFKATVTSGSKGSFINIAQILACVGQQNVEGKRIPAQFHGRTLPHFKQDDLGPESRGFVENSYLKGLSPQEFYFHAMGGREGLIDTACKTADTGYIQRRLVKSLESVMVRYDGTVRNSEGHIIQFLYGEDGISGEYCEGQRFKILTMDNASFDKMYVFDDSDFASSYMSRNAIDSAKDDHAILNSEIEQLQRDREEVRRVAACREKGKEAEEVFHVPVNIMRLIRKVQTQYRVNVDGQSDLLPRVVINEVRALLVRLKAGIVRSVANGGDNSTDIISEEAQRNATTLFGILLRSHVAAKRIIKEFRLSSEAFKVLIGEIEARYMKSIVAPGEMCGVIAAQSIGEPATQMTLNTFHFAGVSSKNVTLGVPRLKEIINVARNIKTPGLTVYLSQDVREEQDLAKGVLSDIEYATLGDITEMYEVLYDPEVGETVVEGDQFFVEGYYATESISSPHYESWKRSSTPWVLRIVLSMARVTDKKLHMRTIATKVREYLADIYDVDLDVVEEERRFFVLFSDDNAEQLVLRIRLIDPPAMGGDEGADGNVSMQRRDVEGGHERLCRMGDLMQADVKLRGIEGIKKVYMRKDAQSSSQVWDEENGGFKPLSEWILETDGSNLMKVMAHRDVDHTRTTCNDIIEVLETLGIEAARKAIMNEVRNCLATYGLYVNYRHLGTLCDVMTSRGHIMAITRHGTNRVDHNAIQRASFEETVEILFESATFSEKAKLNSVSANILMGQLSAVGTGIFDLMLDEQMCNSAMSAYEHDDDAAAAGGEAKFFSPEEIYQDTPMQTPMMETPGQMSEYVGGATPASVIAQFSPDELGAGNDMSSRGEHSSEAYTPTSAGSSNIYSPMSPAYAYSPKMDVSPMSPAYSPNDDAPSSSYSPSSPAYSPTSPAYSPTSPAYSPTSPAYSPTSPAYSPTSPAYSPTSPAYSPTSPAYSPTSPAYSPTSPAYSPTSPAYSPTSPAYSPTSPAYSPTSPAYSPTSPAYSPTSPAYSPTSPAYSPTSPAYSPTSPAYSPTSPAYSPTSPAYSPTSPAYSPTSPAYKEEKEIIHRSRPPIERNTAAPPVREILTNPRFIAIVAVHMCYNFGYYMVLSWVAKFFQSEFNVSYRSLGTLSIMPYITVFLASNAAGKLADMVESRTQISATTLRKIFNTVGMGGAALFFFLLSREVQAGHTSKGPLFSCIYLTAAVGIGGAAGSGGYWPALSDLSVEYSQVVVAFSNSIATIPGILSGAVVGYILSSTGNDWSAVFSIAAIVEVVGAVIFLFKKAAEDAVKSTLNALQDLWYFGIPAQCMQAVDH